MSEARSVRPIWAAVVLGVAALLGWCALSRSHSTPTPSAPVVAAEPTSIAAAPPSAPAPAALAAPDVSRCSTFTKQNCTPERADLFFTGDYLDAKCSQAVAHAQFSSCTMIKMDPAPIAYFAEAGAGHGHGDSAAVAVLRQVSATEAQRLYRKTSESPCAPQPISGIKLTPEGCEGKFVCRAGMEAGRPKIACGASCVMGPDGCPSYEGSRLYVAFRP